MISICFCYFCKKNVFWLWVWPMGTPFLYNLGQKLETFRGFSNFFFRIAGFQLKLLILIESPNIFHWKPAKKIKVGWSLDKIRPNVVKKVKEQVLGHISKPPFSNRHSFDRFKLFLVSIIIQKKFGCHLMVLPTLHHCAKKKKKLPMHLNYFSYK